MKPSSEIKDPVRSIRARNGRTSPPKSIYINPMTSSDRYRPLSFTATSHLPRPGPTSPSASQRSRGLCA